MMSDPDLTDRFAWSGVVTTVDAMAAEQTFDHHPESIKQVAVADWIVLTKADLFKGTSGKSVSRPYAGESRISIQPRRSCMQTTKT